MCVEVANSLCKFGNILSFNVFMPGISLIQFWMLIHLFSFVVKNIWCVNFSTMFISDLDQFFFYFLIFLFPSLFPFPLLLLPLLFPFFFFSLILSFSQVLMSQSSIKRPFKTHKMCPGWLAQWLECQPQTKGSQLDSCPQTGSKSIDVFSVL